MADREVVYLNRDNTFDRQLKTDGAAQVLTAVTRMIVEDIGGRFTVDSNIESSAFDWDNPTTGHVIFNFGDVSLPAGIYQVRLIVYDPTNPDGIVWGDKGFELEIINT